MEKFHVAFTSTTGYPKGVFLALSSVLYTSDFPTSRGTTLGTFVDDAAIFSTHEDPKIASLNLQEHISSIEKWLQKWKIKVNQSKSSHITFTLRKCHCPAVSINQTIIPQAESVKYLCLQFDRSLTWKDHIAKKRKQIILKIKEINWLIGRKSHLSVGNKVLPYKAIIKPIWSYGIELWGCACKSHIVIMQRTHSKILRAIANSPWYVTNHTLH
jgi:hypothetical protein